MAGQGGARFDGIRPATFSVKRSEREDLVVLTVAGELDMATVDRFAALVEGIPPGRRVVVGLGDLEFIDSAGLHLLLNLDLRSRQEGWELALARPRTAVLRMLKLLKIDSRIPILDAPP